MNNAVGNLLSSAQNRQTHLWLFMYSCFIICWSEVLISAFLSTCILNALIYMVSVDILHFQSLGSSSIVYEL